MLLSDYHRPYASPPPLEDSLPSQRTKKRKRIDESDDPARFEEHVVKRTREGDLGLVTPLSPPSSAPSVERSTPEREQTYHNHPTSGETKQTSYIEQSPQHYYEPSQPDETQYISSQNRLLHQLHMKSRIYEYNQSLSSVQEMDEDMWDEEEESVAERYAEINKLLGSRRMNLS